MVFLGPRRGATPTGKPVKPSKWSLRMEEGFNRPGEMQGDGPLRDAREQGKGRKHGEELFVLFGATADLGGRTDIP
jgi:hypothetical protein